jgi:hypothetical protein
VPLWQSDGNLDSFCARRRPKSAVGAEESLREIVQFGPLAQR